MPGVQPSESGAKWGKGAPTCGQSLLTPGAPVAAGLCCQLWECDHRARAAPTPSADPGQAEGLPFTQVPLTWLNQPP